MLQVALNERQNDESGEIASRLTLGKRDGLRECGFALLRNLSPSHWSRGDFEILTVLAECLGEFLVHLGVEPELLAKNVTEILHVGQIAALVVFKDALEDIDVQKRLPLEFEFRF